MLLAAAATAVFFSGGVASQERFEGFIDPAQYNAALKEAAQYLRLMLAMDDVFILTYMGALGFAALTALTFVLPKERFFEALLVWATRLIFPAATALFVTGAFDLRRAGLYAIYIGMLSGFVSLAIVTYNRSRDGLRLQ